MLGSNGWVTRLAGQPSLVSNFPALQQVLRDIGVVVRGVGAGGLGDGGEVAKQVAPGTCLVLPVVLQSGPGALWLPMS